MRPAEAAGCARRYRPVGRRGGPRPDQEPPGQTQPGADAGDSPNLRFLFDTGNTLTVCEDPVDAAREAAKYTVLVHLKDLKVHPWNPGREFVSVMYSSPLGRGHVDNKQIVKILRENAPN